MASRPDVEGGFVLIYRRLLDHTAFRNDAEAMVFAWLVIKAAWKPTRVRYKDHSIELERGQLAISVRDLAQRFEWTKDRAQRFLKALATRDMLATDRATGVNVVTIRNYDDYQASTDSAATPKNRKPRQDRDRTATVNNEGNKGTRNPEGESFAAGKPAAPAGAKPKTLLPSDWQPTLPVSGKAGEACAHWSPEFFAGVVENFRDHHTAKSSRMADWDAALRTWISNEVKWGRTGNGSGNRRGGANGDEFGNGLTRAAASVLSEGRAAGSGGPVVR